MTYRFAFRRYSLPFTAPVRTAHGFWTHREGVLIRVEDAAGRIGFGEAAPIPWFGTETADEVAGACDSLGDAVSDPLPAPEDLRCLQAAWRSATAMLRMDRPTEEGHAHLPVAALLPAGRAALERVEPLVGAGFRAFKWKVGVRGGADERALLDDLLAALPRGAKLRLDANGAWDRREAERWLDCCAERPIEFLEQPIAPDRPDSEDLLRGLAADFPTPIALDESVVTARHVTHWLGVGWPGVYVVKPSLLGDPAAALEALSRAGAPVVFSSALETAVGAQAALRHAFAFLGEARAVGFGVYPLFADARFDGPSLAPFLRRGDLERFNPEVLWNALS